MRLRQLVPWAFAGAPGHPALRELCDLVAAAVRERRSFSSDARLDGLERSGAGLFTDVLLRHAASHPPAARQDPWGVRLLPRVLLGAPEQPAYGLSGGEPGVAVLRHASAGLSWEQPSAARCAVWQLWLGAAAAAAARLPAGQQTHSQVTSLSLPAALPSLQLVAVGGGAGRDRRGGATLAAPQRGRVGGGGAAHG